MRVLLINKFWKPFGGVEEHAFTLKRVLEELGHDVQPFAMADPENLPADLAPHFPSLVDFRGDGFSTKAKALSRAVFGRATLAGLRRVLDDHEFDVVHVLHTYHQLGTTLLPMLRRRGIPTVLSLHDYKVACPNYRLFSDATGRSCTRCLDNPKEALWAPALTGCWSGSHFAGAMLSVEAAAVKAMGTYRKGANVVIVLNELQRRAVAAAGVAPEIVRTIPHFVEVSGEPTVAGRHGALYVGRLVPEKGVDVLIRACAAAGVALRVAGDGRDRAELEALARELDGDVQFLGPLGRDDVVAEMSRASVLCVPSLWHEVSPLVIIEAFGAGLPVIGTEMGGIPDLLRDGRGFLVPAGDVAALASTLRSVADDEPLRRRVAGSALVHARTELTRDAWVARLMQAYEDAGASAAKAASDA